MPLINKFSYVFLNTRTAIVIKIYANKPKEIIFFFEKHFLIFIHKSILMYVCMYVSLNILFSLFIYVICSFAKFEARLINSFHNIFPPTVWHI